MIRNSIKHRLLLGGMIWSLLLSVSGVVALYSIYTSYQRETYYAGIINNLKLLRDFHNHQIINNKADLDSLKSLVAEYFENGEFDKPYSAWFWQIRERNGNVIVSRSLFDCELVETTVHCPNSSRDIQANESRAEFITSGNITPDFEYAIYKIKGILNQNLRIIVSNYVDHQYSKKQVQYTVSGRYLGLEEVSKEFAIISAISILVLILSTLVAIIVSMKFGFKPIDTIRNNLIEIRQGKAEQLVGEFPNEIKPLVDEFHYVFQNINKIEVENLSHNLKTPLSVLINESAKQSGELSDIVKRQAQYINRSIEHYLQRSRQPIKLSSIYAGVNVPNLFSHIRQQLKSIAVEKNIKLNFICEQPLMIKADWQDLQEALTEFVINATKHSKYVVEMSANRYGNNIVISIEDDGPGISKSHKQSVLQRGYQVDENELGTGIGMASSNNRILRMQGSLLLKTSKLGGLRVVVTLPVAEFNFEPLL